MKTGIKLKDKIVALSIEKRIAKENLLRNYFYGTFIQQIEKILWDTAEHNQCTIYFRLPDSNDILDLDQTNIQFDFRSIGNFLYDKIIDKDISFLLGLLNDHLTNEDFECDYGSDIGDHWIEIKW